MPELTDTLPVAVYTTDVAGTITHFNEAAAFLWGRRPVLGEDRWCGSWQLFWTDGTPLPHEQCPMAVALKENRPIRGLEAVALRPDGSHVIFAPYPTPLHDQDGELIGAVNVLVDITDRKAAEDGLTAARIDLERRVQDSATQLIQARKMEAVGQITCGMVHDFNNVLQGVGSCLAALEEHVVGDRGRELLATARQGIERGSGLTRGLLAFARHEALPPRPTAMSVVLEGLRGILECSMGSLIRVETRIADDVWPALIDPTQLELALINLAINARDAVRRHLRGQRGQPLDPRARSRHSRSGLRSPSVRSCVASATCDRAPEQSGPHRGSCGVCSWTSPTSCGVGVRDAGGVVTLGQPALPCQPFPRSGPDATTGPVTDPQPLDSIPSPIRALIARSARGRR